jgi:hypothetical protein
MRVEMDIARAEEEQRLEDRVVERVQQRACQPQGDEAGRSHATPEPCHRQPQPNNADVLDGMMSEQPLDFVLRKRVSDAADGRNQRHCEQRTAEGLRGRRKEHEHPCDAVNPGLNVDRRKQARNVRRCSRVRIRKPRMERHLAAGTMIDSL